MTQRKMTTAYLAKFTKSHGFQKIQKELVHCSNTLLSGSTMGARIRRREFIAMVKEVHSLVNDQIKTHNDASAFEALEAKKEVTVRDIKAVNESNKATKELNKAAKAADPKSSVNVSTEEEDPKKKLD